MKIFKGVALIVAVTLFVQPVFALATTDLGGVAKSPSRSAYVPGEVIVKFKESRVDLKNASGIAKSSQFAVRQNLLVKENIRRANLTVLKTKGEETVESAIARLKKDADVLYAEPNYRRYPSGITTNDTSRGLLWGLNNTGQTVGGTYTTNNPGSVDKDIDAPEAWAISEATTSAQVIVAVIDSGVAYNHPDLAANMWDGTNCKDDTGALLGGCNHGYDYEDGDNIPLPTTDSHGTHVAGTIAAVKNNSKGIIGVAPQAKIMAIKFGLDIVSEVKAIDFAIQNGAKVINASFGGVDFSQSEYDAINRFKTAGGILVASAGNGGDDQIGDNNDVTPQYPANYNLDNIISVAATDQNDSLATFSNYGTTSVDVGAPGTNIYSTVADTNAIFSDGSDEKYEYYSGTSMAAPHVAGLAALIQGYNPNLTVAQVKNAILNTGDTVSSLATTTTGKRINAQKALHAVNPAKDIVAFSFPAGVGVITGTNIAVTVPFGTAVTALVPTITLSGGTVSPNTGVAQNFTAPVTYTVTAADASTKAYTITVNVALPVASSVVSQTPINGALNVATTSAITVVFDRAITASSTNISFSPLISFSISTTTNTLTITPSSSLALNTTYTLTLAGISDGSGNVLSSTSKFTTTNTYSIQLYNNATSGLNLISIPVVPTNTAIANVLGSASSAIDSVWSYDPGNPSADPSGWLVYRPTEPTLSSLTSMTSGYAYWIKVHTAATLSGTGSLYTPGATAPPSRTLQSGWNLLGYYQLPGEASSTPTKALTTLSNYTSVVGYDNATGAFKGVSDIQPGEGLWIGLPSAGQSYYPSYSASAGSGEGTFNPPEVPGTVSVTKSASSPSSNVAVGATNVKWATFDLVASGEDMKIETLNIRAVTSRSGGLDNGKVFLNGVQVSSTNDLTDATDVNFTFGSSMILKDGITAIVDIYADAKTTTGAAFSNGDSAYIRISAGSANGEGVATGGIINVPDADVIGNTITMSASSLTAAKASSYSNQTMVAGTSNAKMGSFTLSVGSIEGVNVNTITITLSGDEAATITDLMLKDNATGAQIGTTKASPGTSNSFSVNLNVDASATQVIDVYANIKSAANNGIWTATIDASATGSATGSAVAASAVDLQTITLSTAILTATVNTGKPGTRALVWYTYTRDVDLHSPPYGG